MKETDATALFPGGFGTLDELMVILTLVQTRKLAKKMSILLYGSGFWKEIINFDALVKHGMISREDLSLFEFADDPRTAYRILTENLMRNYLSDTVHETPAIARSNDPQDPAGTP